MSDLLYKGAGLATLADITRDRREPNCADRSSNSGRGTHWLGPAERVLGYSLLAQALGGVCSARACRLKCPPLLRCDLFGNVCRLGCLCGSILLQEGRAPAACCGYRAFGVLLHRQERYFRWFGLLASSSDYHSSDLLGRWAFCAVSLGSIYFPTGQKSGLRCAGMHRQTGAQADIALSR